MHLTFWPNSRMLGIDAASQAIHGGVIRAFSFGIRQVVVPPPWKPKNASKPRSRGVNPCFSPRCHLPTMPVVYPAFRKRSGSVLIAHQGRTRGRTEGGIGIRICESNALACNSVDVRCGNVRTTMRPNISVAHIIGEDKHDVGAIT